MNSPRKGDKGNRGVVAPGVRASEEEREEKILWLLRTSDTGVRANLEEEQQQVSKGLKALPRRAE